MINLRSRRELMLAACLAAASSVLPVHAGESIIVPSEKSKAAPLEPKDKQLLRLREKAPGSQPIDEFNMPLALPRTTILDLKEEKRRRLQRLEQKNWMVVNEGDLQSGEDENNFLNVRDPSLDNVDGEGDNLMFFQGNKDDKRRLSGPSRSPNDSRAAQRNNGRPAETEADRRALDNDPQLGAHVANELNFSRLFESRQSSDSLTPKFNKSDLSLQTLLNPSGGNPDWTKEQQARREEFRKFLNKPQTGLPLAGPSDPINSRNDFTRQPLNPTMPQPFGNTAGRSPSQPGFSTFNAAAPTAPGFSAGPLLRPQEQPRGLQKAPASFDPPRRKF